MNISRLSLRWQLSVTMMLVLSLTLIVALSLVLRNARKAVDDEVRASFEAASSSLDATILLLALRPHSSSRETWRSWADAQQRQRHLCVYLGEPVAGAGCERPDSQPLTAPAWFADDIISASRRHSRSLPIDNGRYQLVLSADPVSELNEAWSETRFVMQLIVLMAFIANLLIVLLVRRALRPLQAARQMLEQMQHGDINGRLPRSGAADLRQLFDGILQLQRRLSDGIAENRRLLLRNLDAQEDERRLIATELHDEMGQHVAAIEMATILLQQAQHADGDAALQRIRDSVAEIHQLSRRMSRRLRPAALDTLGLAGGLQTLIGQWRSMPSPITIVDDIDRDCDQVEPYVATHVYRIVQEALSNALRHSRAERITIQVRIVAGAQLHLGIADDGHGFDPSVQRPGLGLIGIRERIKALGGTLDLRSSAYAGCALQVSLPLAAPRLRRHSLEKRPWRPLEARPQPALA